MRALSFFVLNIFCLPLLFATPLSFPKIESSQDIVNLFPKSPEEIKSLKEETIANSNLAIKELNQNIKEGRPFDSILRDFDAIPGYLTMQATKIQAFFLVAPSVEMRNEAMTSLLELEEYGSKIYQNETAIYQEIKRNQDLLKSNLDETQAYLIEQILLDFEKAGQSLPQAKKEELAKLNREISELTTTFQNNIQTDSRYFFTKKENLDGVSSNVIENLPKNENGDCQIGCDYPTFFPIMATCNNGEIRKKLLNNFNNQAYPDNEVVLSQLIEKRDQYASLLGHKSFAHLSLSNEMAKDPKTVSAFLKDLWNKSFAKADTEFKALSINLPPDVHLTKEGKIKAWDANYTSHYYKKKHYNIDDQQIAEYFPLDSTLSGLMSIYEQFFNIQIKEEPIEGLWHPDVSLLKISEKNGEVIGYVLMDLFPRANKYGHACDLPGIAPPLIKDGKANPGLDLVIANFTKPNQDTPSLLKHSEVTTIFHEFGHALHGLFSKNEYLSFAGLSSPYMKYDFVELPSQMLEEWMWEPEILKMLSKHYKTNKSLPDNLIQKLVYSKSMDSGRFIQRQSYLSFLALNYYSEGENKNLAGISKDLYKHLCPQYEPLENSRRYLSFGHLTGYGPRYYGYLWARVYAADVFKQIKAEGLLNPDIGTRYRKTILEKGASVDPNILLTNFLGREPNQEAFIEDLSLEVETRQRDYIPL